MHDATATPIHLTIPIPVHCTGCGTGITCCAALGSSLGDKDGTALGSSLGSPVGDVEGICDGNPLGDTLGNSVQERVSSTNNNNNMLQQVAAATQERISSATTNQFPLELSQSPSEVPTTE